MPTFEDDDLGLSERTERPLRTCMTCRHGRAMRRRNGLCKRAKKDALAESIWGHGQRPCVEWEGIGERKTV